MEKVSDEQYQVGSNRGSSLVFDISDLRRSHVFDVKARSRHFQFGQIIRDFTHWVIEDERWMPFAVERNRSYVA
jgi:hypothetical protein